MPSEFELDFWGNATAIVSPLCCPRWRFGMCRDSSRVCQMSSVPDALCCRMLCRCIFPENMDPESCITAARKKHRRRPSGINGRSED